MDSAVSINKVVETKSINIINKLSEAVQPRELTKKSNAGRPKGSLSKTTLEQRMVQQAVNQRIMQHADRLINAQFALAEGQHVLMVIVTEGEGKNQRRYHEQVTDPELIRKYLDWEEGINDEEDPGDDNHYYYLTTKSPDNKAIDSLLNRALGKAPDKLEITGGFFSKSELTIKVVGSDHERTVIDISEDGQLTSGPSEGSDSDAVEKAGPSFQAPEPSPSS